MGIGIRYTQCQLFEWLLNWNGKLNAIPCGILSTAPPLTSIRNSSPPYWTAFASHLFRTTGPTPLRFLTSVGRSSPLPAPLLPRPLYSASEDPLVKVRLRHSSSPLVKARPLRSSSRRRGPNWRGSSPHLGIPGHTAPLLAGEASRCSSPLPTWPRPGASLPISVPLFLPLRRRIDGEAHDTLHSSLHTAMSRTAESLPSHAPPLPSRVAWLAEATASSEAEAYLLSPSGS